MRLRLVVVLAEVLLALLVVAVAVPLALLRPSHSPRSLGSRSQLGQHHYVQGEEEGHGQDQEGY